MQRLSAASLYDSDLGIGLGTPMDTASICSSVTSDSGVSVGPGASGQIPGLRRMQFPRPVRVSQAPPLPPPTLTSSPTPPPTQQQQCQPAGGLARPRTLQHLQLPQQQQQNQQARHMLMARPNSSSPVSRLQQHQLLSPSTSSVSSPQSSIASGRSTPQYAVPDALQQQQRQQKILQLQKRSLPPPPTPPPPPPPPAYSASHTLLTSRTMPAAAAAASSASAATATAGRLSRSASGLGACGKCTEAIAAPSEACHALGKVFHSACFTCHCCGRELTGETFYAVPSPSEGAPPSVFCAQDFLYTGFQQSSEACSACGHLITDQILQALGRPFHPACFRCSVCQRCLDGRPFTVDVSGSVFCVSDYHRVYAPRCYKCAQPIAPETEAQDEVLRIVSMGKDFHLACYRCEDCGMQLSNESHRRCYPLVDKALNTVQLFCYTCRIRRND
ncbi:hypothetical protein BOX15_Mlig023115g1 [Macrostomum lignano]|uniref:LIM zinc-binding domain-containing protein n=1 Tax=Macrostomum lignano TaxID=282301 RepID=A0A267H8T9_9PLAT|nr:hypothetical protein BOX15_Mlig023115g1 [Macrostomum lignano]